MESIMPCFVHKKSAVFVFYLLGGTSLLVTKVAISASIDGVNAVATVNPGDAKQSWRVDSGAKLYVKPGGITDSIEIRNGSKLYMDGAKTNTINNVGLYFRSYASANIINSTIASQLNYGVEVSGVQGGDNILFTDSVINGFGRGVSVLNERVVLSGTQSYGSDDGNTGFSHGGTGLFMIASTASVQNNSLIQGETQGVLMDYQGYGPAQSELTVDNSEIKGLSGSAITVGSSSNFVIYQGIISVKNGSVLTGGNGKILEVVNNSNAILTVDNSQLSGDVFAESGSIAHVVLDNKSSLTGTVTNGNNLQTLNAGQWNITGDSNISRLKNGGTVGFTPVTAGHTLTVRNYVGNNGLLIFNSVLEGDQSVTDKMIVTGDTEGNTSVAVNNLGGSGASTVEGIELISVAGRSGGEFTQQGRIAAGAYDYKLIRGGGANAANWYLTSSLTVDPVIPAEPGKPSEPVLPVQPGRPENPATPAQPDNPVESGSPVYPNEPEQLPTSQATIRLIRPEAGAYISNLVAANTLFALSLDGRLGETEFTNAVTGEKELTSMWMYSSGGHTRAGDNSGQLSTQTNRYVTVLGGDLATGTSNYGSIWRLGALAGYGYTRSNTRSDLSGYRAKGGVQGYTTGLYGSWHENGIDDTGLYVDSMLQYSWFDNSVSGDDIPKENYQSRGFTASLENGYVLRMSEGIYLQPKAQVAWSGIRANDHTEANGTRVTGSINGNLRSSVGIRAFLKSKSAVDAGEQHTFKPYVEVNWVHNTESYGVSMNDVNFHHAGMRNIGEVKLGVEGHMTKNLNLTGSVGQQIGTDNWSDTASTIGIKYAF